MRTSMRLMMLREEAEEKKSISRKKTAFPGLFFSHALRAREIQCLPKTIDKRRNDSVTVVKK